MGLTIDKSKIFNRGAIIAPPLADRIDGFSINGEGLEDQYRFAALYFDRALDLSNNLIHLGPPRVASDLQEVNFLQHKMLRYSQYFNNKADGRGPLGATMIADAFASIPNVQRGRWSLVGKGQIESSDSSDFNTIFVNLMGKLPLPTPVNSIQEILQFNKNNRKNLLTLRRSIGDMAQIIQNSDSKEGLKQHVEDKVDAAFDDLDALISQSKIDRIRSSISIGFQIPAVIVEVVVAALGVVPGVATAISNSVSISLSKKSICPKGAGARLVLYNRRKRIWNHITS